MDFDFNHITAPFRIRPGLARLQSGAAQLTPLDPRGSLYADKLAVQRSGQSRLVVPGFDAGPALSAIADQVRACGASESVPVELAVEEDLAVLDGADGTLPWLCVCVPSHWAPEEKLGLQFAAIHAPVADNAPLLAASGHLVGLATGGACWERYVWTITPSAQHDRHPARHPRMPWPDTTDPQVFAAQCYLRAERQTFFPVGQGTRQAVFTIRVMVEPLVSALCTPERAQRLHAALASMSATVLDYKGLAQAQPPLLRWLETFA